MSQPLMKRLWKEDDGQSLVEFAVVLPVLLLVIIGILDFGKIFFSDIVLNEAARDAARYASIGYSDTQIQQVIDQDCTTLQTSNLSISINPPDYARTSGDAVTITISYPVSVDPPLSAILGNTLSIAATMTMRVE